jgi:hypothetical protein
MPDEFDIKKFFKRFSAIEVYLWLAVIGTHPNNQHYQSRFSFLINLLFSIPENEFQKRIPNREIFLFFFKKISELFSNIFVTIEDFEGFPQSSLIPLLHDGNKYYCFYGTLERPIELYTSFFDLYFYDTEISNNDIALLREVFIDSLNFQTAILIKISTLEERNIEFDGVYVPTEIYFNEIGSLFLVESSIVANTYPLGCFNGIETRELLNRSVGDSLFTQTVIYDTQYKRHYYLMPQLHIEALFLSGKSITQESLETKKQLHISYKQRLVDLLNRFFRASNQIHGIFLELTTINILDDNIDYAVLVDSNKLFLFSAVDHSIDEDISDNLFISIESLSRVAKTVTSNDIIGILQPNGKTIVGYAGKRLEVFICPIFEPINFNFFARKSSEDPSGNLFMVSFMDLKAIFSKIDNPFNFLKFLREEENLKSRIHRQFLGEFIERFAYYLENDNAYFQSGQEMHAILFEPHSWHYKIMPELYEKSQDDTYEIIENKFPGFFDKIEKREVNIYRMMNTSYIEGAYLIRWTDRNIWLLGQPGGLSMSFQEAQVTYDVLMMLFAEYLSTLQSEISKVLSREIGQQLDYKIVIISVNHAKNQNYYQFLKNKLSELSDTTPIVFDTRKYGNQVRTTVIFNHEGLPNIFSQNDNFGERFCLKGLIESIYLYNSILKETATILAIDFINKFIPLGKRRYSIELLSHANRKLVDYNRPIQINSTDIAIINRKISQFLITNSYNPGEYKNEDAKKLIKAVFNFLQTYLETNVSGFHESLLPFAYTQLELSLGEIENSKLRTGMQAKGIVDFDIIDNQQKVDYKNSSLGANIKHVIHSLLKAGMKGDMHVMNENWSYLLAISSVLLELSYTFDNINFNLRGHILKIDANYILGNRVGEEIFDSFTYRQDRAVNAIDIAKQSHSKSYEVEELSETYAPTDEMVILNEAFQKEFSFKYDDLMFVLISMRSIDWRDGVYTPLVFITIDELINEIHKAGMLNIAEEEIRLIIQFLSLNVGIYNAEFSLLPSNLMLFKERVSVSPFIRIKDKILFGREACYVSANFWNSLVSGNIPFKLSKESLVQKAINALHKKIDLELEKEAEEKAKSILSDNFVEARILNFKRLSATFKPREDCGEIDVLCINPEIKTVFVLDAKNVNKKVSPYYIKKNIYDFILDEKSYHNKLLKKKSFVENNLQAILIYFKQNDFLNWKVKEAFITNNKHFAAYYIDTKVDFIEIEDMNRYLTE